MAIVQGEYPLGQLGSYGVWQAHAHTELALLWGDSAHTLGGKGWVSDIRAPGSKLLIPCWRIACTRLISLHIYNIDYNVNINNIFRSDYA